MVMQNESTFQSSEQDVIIIQDDTSSDIIKLSDELSIVCNFLILTAPSKEPRIVMPSTYKAKKWISKLSEADICLTQKCWNNDNFENCQFSKLPDIQALFNVVASKEVVWEDGVTRNSIRFRLKNLSWHIIALADSFSEDDYSAVTDFFGEKSDSYSEGFRTTLHTLLNIQRFNIADYPNNPAFDNPQFMVAVKQEMLELFSEAAKMYKEQEMPFTVKTFFNPKDGGNFFSLSDDTLKKYAHEFAAAIVKFRHDFNEETDIKLSAAGYCKAFAKYVIDEVAPAAAAKTVEFLRFLCHDGPSLKSFADMRRSLDVFKCAMKVGCLLLPDFAARLAASTDAQGMRLVSNVYQAVVKLEETSIRPVNTYDEGRVIIHNRFFTWSDVKLATDFLITQFNNIWTELNFLVNLPSVKNFHQEYIVENPYLNGARLGAAQTHNISFRESFGKYPSCAVFHLVQSSLEKCSNTTTAEFLVNKLIALIPCMIQWAGCAPIRSPEFDTYCLSGTLRSLQYQKDAMIIKSFYSKTTSSSANAMNVRVLPGDCGVILMYHAIVLKHVQLYLFKKNNVDNSVFIIPDSIAKLPNETAFDTAVRFIQEKVFVNSGTLNYFDHPVVFKKMQPWSAERKLGLSDYRHAIIALQKSTTFDAPLVDDSHKVFAHLSGHNVSTRMTSYGTNATDANSFASLDTGIFRRVIEYLHQLAAFEPVFKWPSIKSTAAAAETTDSPAIAATNHAAAPPLQIARGHHLHEYVINSDTYLRPLQKFVCTRLLSSANTFQLFEMGTGAGKTATIIRMLQLLCNHGTHLVHVVMEPVKALAKQVVKRLRDAGIDAGSFDDIEGLVPKNVYVFTYADLTADTTSKLHNICIELQHTPGFCFLDEIHSAVADSSYRFQNLKYLPSFIKDISWISIAGFTATMGDTAEMAADWFGYKKGGVKYIDQNFKDVSRVSVPFEKYQIEPIDSTHSTYCYKLVSADPTAHLSLRTINNVDRHLEVLVKLVQPKLRGAVLCYRLADVAKVVNTLNYFFGAGYALPVASTVAEDNIDKIFENQPHMVVGTSALNMGIDLMLDYTVLFDYRCNPYELLQWLGRQRRHGDKKFLAFEIHNQEKTSNFSTLKKSINNFYNIDAKVDHIVLKEIDVHLQLPEMEINEKLNDAYEHHNLSWCPEVDMMQSAYWSSTAISAPVARVPIVEHYFTPSPLSNSAKRVSNWGDDTSFTENTAETCTIISQRQSPVVSVPPITNSLTPSKRPRLATSSSTPAACNIFSGYTVADIQQSHKGQISIVGFIYAVYNVFEDIYNLKFTDGTASSFLDLSFANDRNLILDGMQYTLPNKMGVPVLLKGYTAHKIIRSLGIEEKTQSTLDNLVFVVVNGSIGPVRNKPSVLEIKAKTIQLATDIGLKQTILQRLKSKLLT